MAKPIEQMNKEELIQLVYSLSRDGARLDFLQGKGGEYGVGWVVRCRSGGGYALHETSRTLPGVSSDVRMALDHAMEGEL